MFTVYTSSIDLQYDYDTRLLPWSLLQDIKWDGLAQGSLFQKPKANVVISLVSYEYAPLTIQNKARYPTNDVSVQN